MVLALTGLFILNLNNEFCAPLAPPMDVPAQREQLIEHHLYPSVRFYNLPDGHCEMTPRGILENAEVRKLAETHAVSLSTRRGSGK